MADKDYSISAFNRFFEYAASSGLLKRNTAHSRKAATNKIVDVLEEEELSDLRNINIDQVFERFQNKHSMDYKPDSLQVYLSRARTALTDFISYVDNPSTFKANGAQRSSTKAKSERKKATGPKRAPSQNSSNLEYEQAHDVRHIVVPVPLREGLTVKISNLPADLTVSEAERLAAIVKAYSVPNVD